MTQQHQLHEVGAARMFPIQTQRGAAPHPLLIPWSVAELAYSVYAGKYGHSQSLERLAERGGFGPNEMDMFLPGWRERCDELLALRRRVAELEVTAVRMVAEERKECRQLALAAVHVANQAYDRPTRDHLINMAQGIAQAIYNRAAAAEVAGELPPPATVGLYRKGLTP